MRTRAWAMRTLNTQLASWTQLRHDTVLYAKQSYTGIPLCFYPAGYVEPRVAFWRQFRAMTHRAAERLSRLSHAGDYAFILERHVSHLRHFTEVLDRLAGMASKQLGQEPFTDDEVLFIRNLIQLVGNEPWGSGSTTKYSGWYPGLFYRPLFLPLAEESDSVFHELSGAAAADVIVADVHTDPPSPMDGDPGAVLHQGIGDAQMLVVAIDNGPDRMIYAGPVMSHYEFEVVGPPKRLTDEEWEHHLRRFVEGGNVPAEIEGLRPPDWTREYLRP